MSVDTQNTEEKIRKTDINMTKAKILLSIKHQKSKEGLHRQEYHTVHALPKHHCQ